MHVRKKQDKFKKQLASLEEKEVIAFDLETTGLSSEKDKILQISAIKGIIKNGSILNPVSMDQFINPGIDIPERITEINHISNETVKDCPTIEEFFPTLLEFFGNTPNVIGYNSSFDVRFMNANYERISGERFVPNEHLDVYEYVKDVVETASKKENTAAGIAQGRPENRKLSTIASYYGMDANFHNALDDIYATLFLLNKIKDDYERPYEPAAGELTDLIVLSASYWKGPKNSLQRVYVKTDKGQIFYDLYSGEWKEKDSVGLASCNLRKLENDVIDAGIYSSTYEVSASYDKDGCFTVKVKEAS